MKIVRKVTREGVEIVFVLDADGKVAYDFLDPYAANEVIAESVGTTLSALHQELTEGGEGNG